MKNLDELFKSAARLDAPDTLRRRVMNEIRADEMAAKPGWRDALAEWFRLSLASPARVGFALVAVAALAIAVELNVPAIKHPVPASRVADMSQINDYMHEALSDPYATAWGVNGTTALESHDINEFVQAHVEDVFWIDWRS